MAKIKEIFKSIQGEGTYIGYEQLFIRFCTCNLNCSYCDTEFSAKEPCFDFTPLELKEYIEKNFDMCNVHSISLTGGEPLMSVDFLKEFLPLVKQYKIYLETNATLTEKLAEIIDLVDIVAADIKLKSATGMEDLFFKHDEFLKIAKQKECFAKIVFNEKITDEEIKKSCELAKKYDIELILQPQTIGNSLFTSGQFMEEVLNKFLKLYPKVRLIPQMHKFINVQ